MRKAPTLTVGNRFAVAVRVAQDSKGVVR